MTTETSTLSYFDRTGQEVTFAEWQRRNVAPGYPVLRVSERDDVKVVTIWVGLSRVHDDPGRPSIFDSVVVGGELHDQVCTYSTEDEALEGHLALCTQVFGGDIPQSEFDAAFDEAVSLIDDHPVPAIEAVEGDNSETDDEEAGAVDDDAPQDEQPEGYAHTAMNVFGIAPETIDWAKHPRSA